MLFGCNSLYFVERLCNSCQSLVILPTPVLTVLVAIAMFVYGAPQSAEVNDLEGTTKKTNNLIDSNQVGFRWRCILSTLNSTRNTHGRLPVNRLRYLYIQTHRKYQLDVQGDGHWQV